MVRLTATTKKKYLKCNIIKNHILSWMWRFRKRLLFCVLDSVAILILLNIFERINLTDIVSLLFFSSTRILNFYYADLLFWKITNVTISVLILSPLNFGKYCNKCKKYVYSVIKVKKSLNYHNPTSYIKIWYHPQEIFLKL